MGEMKFKQKGREEQAEADGTVVSNYKHNFTVIINFTYSIFMINVCNTFQINYSGNNIYK